MTRKSIRNHLRRVAGLGLLLGACTGGGGANDFIDNPNPNAPGDPSEPPYDDTQPPFGDVAPPPPGEQPSSRGGTNGGGGTAGSSGTDTGGTGTGGTGTGGTDGGPRNCTTLCDELATLCGSTPGSSEAQECRNDCMTIPNECFAETEAYLRCFTGPECAGPPADYCATQLNAVVECSGG